MKKYLKIVSAGLLVSLLVGVLVLALPTQSASAKGLNDNPPTAQGLGKGLIKQRLEAAFEKEITNLDRQAENIAKLDEVSSKAQTRIDALKAKGIDTSSLEAALAAFEAKLPVIQASHDNGAVILASHNGFGDNGKVTDIPAARATVKSAHDALQSTRQMMREAIRDLRIAIREFRLSNAPSPTLQP